MYIITFKGKPVPISRVYGCEKKDDWSLCPDERSTYMAATAKRKAIALYLYYVGFTWKERQKGIEVLPFQLVVPPTKKSKQPMDSVKIGGQGRG